MSAVDNALLTTIVSTGGSVLVGIFGMFFTANQLGKRIDDLRADMNGRFTRLEDEFRSFKDGEFRSFKDMVNSKLSAIDLEIARLMDKRP